MPSSNLTFLPEGMMGLLCFVKTLKLWIVYTSRLAGRHLRAVVSVGLVCAAHCLHTCMAWGSGISPASALYYLST